MSKIVFITGATSGFGKACAEKFASHGYDLILNGRREERLENIKEEIEKRFNVAILLLPFDVQKQEDVFRAVQALPEDWQEISILVNNAGLALGRDHFDEASLEDWNVMIDTNLKGLMYVTKAVIPYMIKNKGGHIINMGSVAAKEVYEKGNAYCASKAAVDILSKSMRVDLLRHRIKVTAIHPGAAETEFSLVRFKGDKETAKKIYDGLQPLTGEDIASIVYYCATLPAHVCINDLVVTCTQQADAIYFHREV